jgi:glycosyltransferase involved in cell wall biosynthesis
MCYDPARLSDLREAIAGCDVLLAYPDMLWLCRDLLDHAACAVAVDGYDPVLFERLELDPTRMTVDDQLAWQAQYDDISRYVLARGDFFLCATERQRDWWLGALAAAGRINALTRRDDPAFSRLIDLLPYGIPEQPPEHTRAVLRGALPGVAPGDRIVLWGGGIWEWLDPLTLIRAAQAVAAARPDVKVVFPGTRHPGGEAVPAMRMQREAAELAESLGLLGRAVFMGDWVPYQDWQNVLLESDVGVSLHLDHVEARFSARTRLLSYAWAGLPMVLTRGDELAERMQRAGVATLVEPGDVGGVAQAILGALDRPATDRAAAFEALRGELTWQRAVRSLQAFCERPARAADASFRSRAAPERRDPPAPVHAPSASAALDLPPMTIPPLRVPEPDTAASRLALPLSRALFLWYLADVTAQQDRANQAVQARLDEMMTAARQSFDLLQSTTGALAGQTAELRADHERLVNQLATARADHERLVNQLTTARADHERLISQLTTACADRERLARLVDRHVIPTLEKLDGRLSDAESLQTELAAALAQQGGPTAAE